MRRVAAVALTLAFAGCGDAEPAPDAPVDSVAAAATPDSTTLKACDLVTESELEAILGIDLAAARTTNDYAGDSQCRWDLPGDAQRGVSISLRGNFGLDNYRQVPGAIGAPNIGDDAVWNPTVGQLAVQSGTRVLSIGLLLDEPQRTHAEAVARRALERL